MKAIMYHYIRNKRKDFPYSNILTINDFKNQVNEFNNIGLIKKYDELFIPNNKIILTFNLLIKIFPRVFALNRMIVLLKIK
jgi:hypothetical protein